ncbi:MAG: hypothetical protein KKH34_09230 [Candidatus Omnitrophica bacterium]|nr:hypothetical protein [Candidatus Omnitrophota bacterium]
MSNWTVYQWVWRLESPLFIGMPPAGSLNRCRLYVPSRVIHGALAAEFARLKDNDFPDYGKLGHELALNCRFTYLYPAEKIGDEYKIWLPRYEKEKGFRWSCGSGDSLSDRMFRNSLLSTIAGTAITPDTDSVVDGSLHETECINPFWRFPDRNQSPVYLAGHVLLRNNGFRKQLEFSDLHFLGGDTRYGLGKVRLEKFKDCEEVFGKDAVSVGENPVIKSEYVFGHALVKNNTNMRGQQELLGGWEWKKVERLSGQEERFKSIPWEGKLSWCPGSSCEDLKSWEIEKDKYGYWKEGA